MFYFLKNDNHLGSMSIPNKEMLVIPNIDDIRNYAFLYIYPNGEVDAVIRTYNLAGHYYAIHPLVQISPNLKNFSHYFDDDVTHYNFDEALAANGILAIYYSTSNLMDEEAFGYINMPANLTTHQKEFLTEHRAFFEVYEDILISQYSLEKHGLDSLNELGDGNFLEILDEFCNYSTKRR